VVLDIYLKNNFPYSGGKI